MKLRHKGSKQIYVFNFTSKLNESLKENVKNHGKGETTQYVVTRHFFGLFPNKDYNFIEDEIDLNFSKKKTT